MEARRHSNWHKKKGSRENEKKRVKIDKKKRSKEVKHRQEKKENGGGGRETKKNIGQNWQRKELLKQKRKIFDLRMALHFNISQ